MWVPVVLGISYLILHINGLPISETPTDGDEQHLGRYGNIADWHLKNQNTSFDNWLRHRDNYTDTDPRNEENDNSLIANSEDSTQEFASSDGQNVPPNIHGRDAFHPSSIVDFAQNSGNVRFPLNQPVPSISHQVMTQLSTPEQMGVQEVEVGHPQVDTHRHVQPDFDYQMGHQVHPELLPLFGHHGPPVAPQLSQVVPQGTAIGPPMPPLGPSEPLGLQNRDIASQGSQLGAPMDSQTGDLCCKSKVHHGPALVGPQVPQLGPHGPQMGPLGHQMGPNVQPHMGLQGPSMGGHMIPQVQTQMQPQIAAHNSYHRPQVQNQMQPQIAAHNGYHVPQVQNQMQPQIAAHDGYMSQVSHMKGHVIY